MKFNKEFKARFEEVDKWVEQMPMNSPYFQAVDDTLTYLRGSTGYNGESNFWQDCMDHAENDLLMGSK